MEEIVGIFEILVCVGFVSVSMQKRVKCQELENRRGKSVISCYMDTVGNMLTAIVNAQRVNKERVAVPHSVFSERLARLLQEEGLVAKSRVQEGIRKRLIITLLYDNGVGVIQQAKRVSKPGARRYVTKQELPNAGKRPGIYIVSTSEGLMNQKKARQKGLGGELLGEVWRNK